MRGPLSSGNSRRQISVAKWKKVDVCGNLFMSKHFLDVQNYVAYCKANVLVKGHHFVWFLDKTTEHLIWNHYCTDHATPISSF